jgi:hypothetical protein
VLNFQGGDHVTPWQHTLMELMSVSTHLLLMLVFMRLAITTWHISWPHINCSIGWAKEAWNTHLPSICWWDDTYTIRCHHADWSFDRWNSCDKPWKVNWHRYFMWLPITGASNQCLYGWLHQIDMVVYKF